MFVRAEIDCCVAEPLEANAHQPSPAPRGRYSQESVHGGLTLGVHRGSPSRVRIRGSERRILRGLGRLSTRSASLTPLRFEDIDFGRSTTDVVRWTGMRFPRTGARAKRLGFSLIFVIRKPRHLRGSLTGEVGEDAIRACATRRLS